jgi:hypothetical protein
VSVEAFLMDCWAQPFLPWCAAVTLWDLAALLEMSFKNRGVEYHHPAR